MPDFPVQGTTRSSTAANDPATPPRSRNVHPRGATTGLAARHRKSRRPTSCAGTRRRRGRPSTPVAGLTSAYSSAVFTRISPPLPQPAIDARTTFRLRRQQALRSSGRPHVSFIHEAALRMQFGGRKVLADQLDSLIKDSEAGICSLRVVPFDMDTFPGAGENITFTEGPVPELATLQMDTAQGVLFFDAPADLASHRATFTQPGSLALPDDESRKLIRSIKGST
ncbi:DUF5753 domain-containing protein [Kitasatospora purpeofusca]|uniref:DUF5753 domain-containing protein n=1 Tax=Kitasatospora purpeofusca TaxID=67352 RepID=UPI003404DEEB